MFNIEEIKNPEFIKALDCEKINALADDIRDYMIKNVSRTGGHLVSNLSSVEIELVMHYVFKAPFDKFIFDSTGLGYTHKIITGRAEMFKLLRHQGGISSSIKDCESIYDTTSLNHSGNALGVAYGMALSRELDKTDNEIVVLINNEALYNGSCLEALNQIGDKNKKIIIILNDNDSIECNHKTISKFINNVRNSKEYLHLKKDIRNAFSNNELGKSFINVMSNIKDNIKEQFVNGGIFDLFGINYYGPIDGHDIKEVIKALNKAKLENGPVLVHFITSKSKGYDKFECSDKVSLSFNEPFNVDTGRELLDTPKGYYRFDDLISSKIDRLMTDNEKIIFIATSNINDSGLKGLFAKYPKRTINAEKIYNFAIETAYGLIKNGYYPILEIESSNYRVAYDQFHDLIIANNLSMTLLISKTGLLAGEDFVNQGIYDNLLHNRENLIVSEAFNGEEIKDLLFTSIISDYPFIIRYPKGYLTYQRTDFKKIDIGSWVKLNDKDDYKLSIISYGNDVSLVYKEVVINDLSYQVINARFINPIDKLMLDELFRNGKPILIYQNDYIRGGLADNIIRYANEVKARNIIKVIGIHDCNFDIGTISQMKDCLGTDIKNVFKELKELC